MNKLLIAKHSITGQIIDIKDASNGLGCNCLCSCCGDRLIAKQGEFKGWHFAHESGADCAGARESALHEAAKQIIKQEQLVHIGKYDLITKTVLELDEHLMFFENQFGHRESCKEMLLNSSVQELSKFTETNILQEISASIELCSKEHLSLVDIELEKRISDVGIIPDISCFFDNQPLLIEIVVTHQCDQSKIDKLKTLNIPVIEIYLTSLMKINFTLFDIKEALISGFYKNGNELIKSSDENNGFKSVWLIKPSYIVEAQQHAKEFIIEVVEGLSQEHFLAKIERHQKEKEREEALNKERLLREEKEKSKTKLRLFNSTIIITAKPNSILVWMPYVSRAIYDEISAIIYSYGGKRIQDIRNWVIKNVHNKDELIQTLIEADSIWKKGGQFNSNKKIILVDENGINEPEEQKIANPANREKLIKKTIEIEAMKIKDYYSDERKISEEMKKTIEDLNSLTDSELLEIISNHQQN